MTLKSPSRTQAKSDLRSFRVRLSEAQNHRCCCCGIRMAVEKGYNNSAVTVYYDARKEFSNAFAACSLCVSRRQNRDAMVWYQDIVENGRPMIGLSALRGREDDDLRDSPFWLAIMTRATEIASQHHWGIALGARHRPVLRGLRKLAFTPSNVEFMAQNYCKVIKRSYDASQGSDLRRRDQHDGFPQMWRRILTEAQGWRCAYCADDLQVDDNECRRSYATFDHVVELRNSGKNSLSNVVMACAFCNGTRDTWNMDAYEFAELWQTCGDHMRSLKNRDHVDTATRKARSRSVKVE